MGTRSHDQLKYKYYFMKKKLPENWRCLLDRFDQEVLISIFPLIRDKLSKLKTLREDKKRNYIKIQQSLAFLAKSIKGDETTGLERQDRESMTIPSPKIKRASRDLKCEQKKPLQTPDHDLKPKNKK